MSFRLGQGESVEEGVQRIAREQLQKAVAEYGDAEIDRHETVHQVRKRCKKLRGLIRLVRPQFEDTYDAENAVFRDAAKELSKYRDAHSLVETAEELFQHCEEKQKQKIVRTLLGRLKGRRRQVTQQKNDLNSELEEFVSTITDAQKRVSDWNLNKKKGFKAVRDGLKKTYTRARKAMKTAFSDPSAENFHEWRKRVKYHWYHMRLLRDCAPKKLGKRESDADHLSDVLGDDHDLHVLKEVVQAEPVLDETARRLLNEVINARQYELRSEAEEYGERLFGKPSKKFIEKVEECWQERT